MSRLLLIATSIFFGCTLISNTASADETPKGTTNNATGDNVTNVNKDNWLKEVMPMLPNLICKGFQKDPELQKRLTEIKMTYEQCVASIPDSVSKCQQQLYADIPEKITSDSASVWGRSLGECIGKDFAMKYLVPKS